MPASGPLRPRGAVAALALLLPLPAAALDPAKAITQYVHESWGIADGLPQNTARSIVQTPDGYLWFATQEGLVRFDGVRFTVFDPENTPGMGGKGVNSLHVDRHGTLWVARDFGLSRYRDGVLTAVPVTEGLAMLVRDAGERGDVHFACTDLAGTLWLAVPGGLLGYRDGRFQAFAKREGLPDTAIHALLAARDGGLWIGTANGLHRLKDGRFTTVSSRDGLPSDDIASLAEGRDGSLWVGTSRGLARLKDGTVTTWQEAGRLPSPRVEALHEDRDGNLWIGTVPTGLGRLRDGKLSFSAVTGGTAESGVGSFCEDREGSLWIGTPASGLHRFRDGKVTPFGTPEGLSADMTSGLHEAGDGSLWVGTPGSGLDRLENGKVSTIATKDGLPAADVSALAGARDGGLWIGTQTGGLGRLTDGGASKGTKGTKVTKVTRSDGLTDATVRALLEDSSGVLWIGGNSGLTRLEGAEATRLTAKDGLRNSTTLALAEGGDGTLWVGTSSGVNSVRAGRVGSPPAAAPLAGKSIFTLHADPSGTLWVGTLAAGLSWLRGDRLATVTAADGLFDSTVFRILDDGLGSLWMSCNKGIFRVARSELEAFAEGKVKRISSVAFGVLDGMRSPECNRGGGIRTRDGRLWFSTVAGLVSVDPARIPSNGVVPTVVVETIVADGNRTPLPARGPVRLPPGTERIEIHYTATSLLVPSRVRFRTRLEGVDTGWVDAGARRTAYFTNPAPRAYRFRVTACNDDGVWNEAGASLSFAVEPRVWQTGWFLGLELLAAGALLGAVLQAQRRRHERKRLTALRLADLKRKTEELEYARRVQLALLPKGSWKSGPFEVAGESRPASEVGGDTYGYFPAGPGRFAVVIGDATGHGVAAGLVAGMVKAVLSTLRAVAPAGDPAEWLGELNGALKASIAQRGLGMCLGLAHVDEATGSVSLGIAGVPHSFVCREGRARPERLALSGPPLGYFKKVEPATAELVLAPGDRLVLLTDGLVEQRDASGEMWGYEGVEAALTTLCSEGLPPAAIAAALLGACESFAAGAPLDDDRTVVVLARLPE